MDDYAGMREAREPRRDEAGATFAWAQAPSTSSIVPDSTQEVRRGVTQGQDRLERALARLEQMLVVHYDRLHPFLGPERPRESRIEQDRPAGSPLANALHAYAEKIEDWADGMEGITERIEN